MPNRSQEEDEARYRVLFEHSRDAIMTLAPPNWLFTSGNPATVEMFRVRDEEHFTTLGPFDLSPERQPNGRDSTEMAQEMVAVAMEKGMNFFDWTHQRFDGEVFPATVLLTRVVIDGEPQLTATVRDITERTAREEELRQMHFLSEIALDLADAGYWRVLLDGSNEYISSPNKVRFMGDPPRPGHRYHVVDDWFVHLKEADAGLAEQTWSAFEDALAGRIPDFDTVYAYRRPVDGRIIHVHTRGMVVRDEAGEVVDMYGVSRDITRMVHAQRHLEEARDAAEAANRAKSLFLANMSHEIRTPMNAILGYSQLMLRDKELSQQQAQRVGVIQTSGEHLLGLINDVLEMSKIEAGRVELHEAPFDFHGLVGDIENMFRVRTQEKHLQFRCDVAETVPRRIRADQGKLRQILINLLGNAVKFTEAGEVVLRVAADALGDKRVRVVVEVEDTGIGIEAEAQQRIFDYFEQAKAGRTPGEGSGLGLPISRKYADLMEAELSLASEPGQGSVFRLEFPARLEVGDPAATPDNELFESMPLTGLPAGHGEVRVLIVDDQETNRDLLANLLVDLKFTVRQAADGEQALAAVADWRPHLVLMDMMMPVMDGCEATRRIKEMPGQAGTPVIMVTANVMQEQRDEAMAAGADGFIRKPFRLEEVWRKIARQLSLEVAPPPEPEETLDDADPDLLRRIATAAVVCDYNELLGLIDRLAETHPVTAGLLRRYAHDFDYQRITTTLIPGKTP